jgi:hypothetical protein
VLANEVHRDPVSRKREETTRLTAFESSYMVYAEPEARGRGEVWKRTGGSRSTERGAKATPLITLSC